jgi:hypothetical protein
MKKDFRHTSGNMDDRFFYGREDEIGNIHTNIDIRQHTALIGQRQFGKTALVFKAVSRHEDKPLLAHIDLTRKATLGEAARVFIDSFMSENFGLKRFLIMARTDPSSLFAKILSSVNIVKKIKFNAFELEIKEIASLASLSDGDKSVDLFVSAIELIDTIAKETDKKVVVFIDEFQRLIDFPESKNSDVMWSLRSAIQNSKNITLIVAGSKPTVVKKIISAPDSAFLHSFIIENIYGIEEEDFLNHFKGVCETYSVHDIKEVTRFIYKVCGGIPSYLSLFGRKLFSAAKKKKALKQEMYFVALEEMYLELSSALRLQEENLNDIPHALIVYKSIFAGENPKDEASTLSKTTPNNIQNNTIRKMEEYGYIVKVGRGKYDVVDNVLGYYMGDIIRREQFEALYTDEVLRSLS